MKLLVEENKIYSVSRKGLKLNFIQHGLSPVMDENNFNVPLGIEEWISSHKDEFPPFHNTIEFISDSILIDGKLVLIVRGFDVCVKAYMENLAHGSGANLVGQHAVNYNREKNKLDAYANKDLASLLSIQKVIVVDDFSIYSSRELSSAQLISSHEMQISDLISNTRIRNKVLGGALSSNEEMNSKINEIGHMSAFLFDGTTREVNVPQEFINVLRDNGEYNFGIIHHVLVHVYRFDSFSVVEHFAKIGRVLSKMVGRSPLYKDLNSDLGVLFAGNETEEIRNFLSLLSLGKLSLSVNNSKYKFLENDFFVDFISFFSRKGYVTNFDAEGIKFVKDNQSIIVNFPSINIDYSLLSNVLPTFLRFQEWCLLFYSYVVSNNKLLYNGSTVSLKDLPVATFNNNTILSESFVLVDNDKKPIPVVIV